MSGLKSSGWFQQDSPGSRESGPAVNSDGEETSAQELTAQSFQDMAAAVLSLGPPPLDAWWPGLRMLLWQLPPQDSDERYCLALGEEELAELRLFCALRKQKALGQGVARLLPPKLEGQACEKCREPLKPGEYGVFAARAGEQRCWHRPCFACRACDQTLINLIYFYHDGHLYCGRHHAELLRPRCPACDQLIFSQRCTEAEGRRWHENHFCCQDCAGPLAGARYALPGGSPCCSGCWESRYGGAGCSSAGRPPPGGASPGRTAEREDEPPGGPPPGRERTRRDTPRDPAEDGPCSTCSSSSDSEPDGFFPGRNLPRPRDGGSHAPQKRCTVC